MARWAADREIDSASVLPGIVIFAHVARVCNVDSSVNAGATDGFAPPMAQVYRTRAAAGCRAALWSGALLRGGRLCDVRDSSWGF